MIDAPEILLNLPGPDDTDRLGRLLAAHARPGDTLLLEGPIGAGKSQLARAFIRARLGREEDVPSPSFTLVQEYDSDPPIWHADLYRLSNTDELLELGLEEAFGRDLCLVEWPDRFGSARPREALTLVLRPQGEGRIVEFRGGAGWPRARIEQIVAQFRA